MGCGSAIRHFGLRQYHLSSVFGLNSCSRVDQKAKVGRPIIPGYATIGYLRIWCRRAEEEGRLFRILAGEERGVETPSKRLSAIPRRRGWHPMLHIGVYGDHKEFDTINMDPNLKWKCTSSILPRRTDMTARWWVHDEKEAQKMERDNLTTLYLQQIPKQDIRITYSSVAHT